MIFHLINRVWRVSLLLHIYILWLVCRCTSFFFSISNEEFLRFFFYRAVLYSSIVSDDKLSEKRGSFFVEQNVSLMLRRWFFDDPITSSLFRRRSVSKNEKSDCKWRANVLDGEIVNALQTQVSLLNKWWAVCLVFYYAEPLSRHFFGWLQLVVKRQLGDS